MSCKITELCECLNSTKNLFEYAKDFSRQTIDEELFEPVGPIEHRPVGDLNLTIPESPSTQGIRMLRAEIAGQLIENYYYIQICETMLRRYPVQLRDSARDEINQILVEAKDNVNNVLKATRIGDCLNNPKKCESIRKNALSKLKYRTAKNFELFELLKYKYVMYEGTEEFVFYHTGARSGKQWESIHFLNGKTSDTYNITSIDVTDEKFSVTLTAENIRFDCDFQLDEKNSKEYVGECESTNLNGNQPPSSGKLYLKKQISEFDITDYYKKNSL